MYRNFFFYSLILLLFSCKQEQKSGLVNVKKEVDSFKVYTLPSELKNEYLNFSSPKAINMIAKIENEYFNVFESGISKYYGTQWYNTIGLSDFNSDSINVFQKYSLDKKNIKLDSMHCTIYAIEALKSGFGDQFKLIQKHHKNIWKNREHAGWSIGYILTKYFNWKAYLFISKDSNEYEACIKNFKKDKSYHVWKQPNIPIDKIFDFDNDKNQIKNLLKTNEFGWGFSEQGWHTWITRFDYLKECNWNGAPSNKYDYNSFGPSLFLKTKFTEYYDYNSHIIIFPPKQDKKCI